MKKVRILVSLCGIDFVYSQGEEVCLPCELADSLINAQQAEPLEELTETSLDEPKITLDEEAKEELTETIVSKEASKEKS